MGVSSGSRRPNVRPGGGKPSKGETDTATPLACWIGTRVIGPSEGGGNRRNTKWSVMRWWLGVIRAVGYVPSDRCQNPPTTWRLTEAAAWLWSVPIERLPTVEGIAWTFEKAEAAELEPWTRPKHKHVCFRQHASLTEIEQGEPEDRNLACIQLSQWGHGEQDEIVPKRVCSRLFLET